MFLQTVDLFPPLKKKYQCIIFIYLIDEIVTVKFNTVIRLTDCYQ